MKRQNVLLTQSNGNRVELKLDKLNSPGYKSYGSMGNMVELKPVRKVQQQDHLAKSMGNMVELKLYPEMSEPL